MVLLCFEGSFIGVVVVVGFVLLLFLRSMPFKVAWFWSPNADHLCWMTILCLTLWLSHESRMSKPSEPSVLGVELVV